MVYVAFLRAINVSGKNMIKMDTLRNLFLKAGFSAVETYLQSGNVAFLSDSVSVKKIEDTIEVAIAQEFGLDVKVIVRTRDEIINIIKNNRLLDNNKSIETFYVTIFKGRSLKLLSSDVLVKKNENENYQISEDCIYLNCPDGYGRTKMNNTNLEKLFKDMATTRNWKTIIAIHEMIINKGYTTLE